MRWWRPSLERCCLTASAIVADRALDFQLDLSLVSDLSGRTYIGGQYVAYPFHLCRALRTFGDPAGMPTLYIQSCSGGIFEGEQLRCRLRVGTRAQAHVTTAASTIVHTMEHDGASQHVEIEVASGGYLEYLPDPLILFPGASLQSSVSIHAASGSSVLAWDSFLSHDPKGDRGVFRDLRSELSIRDEKGVLLARDRYHVTGEVVQRAAPGIMGPHRTQGGFVLVRRGAEEWTAKLRDAVSEYSEVYVGVSALPNDAGVWLRALAPDAASLRDTLTKAWSRARELILGAPPAPRRK